MDSKTKQRLNRYLKELDPVNRDGELEVHRASALKTQILQAATRPQPISPSRRGIPILAGAFFGVLMGLIWFMQPNSLPASSVQATQQPVKEKNPFEQLNSKGISELQFTTPKGTRIIWQFKD